MWALEQLVWTGMRSFAPYGSRVAGAAHIFSLPILDLMQFSTTAGKPKSAARLADWNYCFSNRLCSALYILVAAVLTEWCRG